MLCDRDIAVLGVYAGFQLAVVPAVEQLAQLCGKISFFLFRRVKKVFVGADVPFRGKHFQELFGTGAGYKFLFQLYKAYAARFFIEYVSRLRTFTRQAEYRQHAVTVFFQRFAHPLYRFVRAVGGVAVLFSAARIVTYDNGSAFVHFIQLVVSRRRDALVHAEIDKTVPPVFDPSVCIQGFQQKTAYFTARVGVVGLHHVMYRVPFGFACRPAVVDAV